MKANGAGPSLPLSEFDVSLKAGAQNALLATRPHPGEAALWSLREVAAGGRIGSRFMRQRERMAVEVLADWDFAIDSKKMKAFPSCATVCILHAIRYQRVS